MTDWKFRIEMALVLAAGLIMAGALGMLLWTANTDHQFLWQQVVPAIVEMQKRLNPNPAVTMPPPPTAPVEPQP